MAKLSKELRMGIHNRFDIEVVDAKTGEVKQRAQAFNVVCNNYFTNICSSSYGVASNIIFGDGSGTPSATDTALFNYRGVASNASTYSPYDRIDMSQEHLGVWKRVLKRTIPNTEYIGVNITEIGLSNGSPGTLMTHAMLQDMNGNPISISHTSTDIITVYCSIYLHYEAQNSDIHLYHAYSQYSGAYGGLVGYILMWSGVNEGPSYPIMAAGAVQGSPHRYNETYCVARNNINYDGSNKRITYIINQVPISKSNFGGIDAIGFFCSESYSSFATYNTPRQTTAIIEAGKTLFPPTHITGESVGVGNGSTTKFKTKFWMPYNATVYINGVAASGVTVNKLPTIAVSANSYPENLWNTGRFCRRVNKNKVSLIMPFNSEYWFENNDFTTGAHNIGDSNEIMEILVPDIGLYRFYTENGNIKGSNDGETWNDVVTNKQNVQMDQAGAHYKYYKNVSANQNAEFYFNAYDGYNIIFDTPPANGDVITIDYTTDYIPKDSDHVLDVTLTLQFGEYQGQ